MNILKTTSLVFFFALLSLLFWVTAPEVHADPDDCIVASGEFSGSASAGPYTLPEGERIVIKVTNEGDSDVTFTITVNASNLPFPIPSMGIINPGETERLALRATEDITVSANVSVTGPVSWIVLLGECEEPFVPLDDRLLGTAVDVAMYYDEDGVEGLTFYEIDENSNGNLVFYLTPEELAEWDATEVTENTLIAQNADGTVAFYKLTTGEYQLNVGPDADGKVEVTIFDGFPPTNTYGYSFNVYE